jgi:hypothetical protein
MNTKSRRRRRASALVIVMIFALLPIGAQLGCERRVRMRVKVSGVDASSANTSNAVTSKTELDGSDR